MLHFKFKSRVHRLLCIHHKWIGEKPGFFDQFRLALYFHCRSIKKHFGFVRQPKYTLLIDLSMTESDMLENFSSNTKYEVRRGMREGLCHVVEEDLNVFCAFYNLAAEIKGRGHICMNDLVPYLPDMTVTKVVLNGEILSMHSYLCDPYERQVVLYQSASPYKASSSSSKRALIGRANRWLHWQDMLYFKTHGALIYDFGGYAKDTTDIALSGINKFKLGFGGDIIEMSNYISLPIIAWNTLKGRTVRV